MNYDVQTHLRNYSIYRRRKAVKKTLFALIWFVFGIAIRQVWLMRFGY